MTEKITKTQAQWREQLSPEQYRVTREAGTERPFTGEYNDFYEQGEYDCVCCGHTLFESGTKFHSGCGWPSFHGELEQAGIVHKRDLSLGMVRTELLCPKCDAHLGHVFDDGPPPSGQRYCINSASITFRPDAREASVEDGSEDDA